MRKERISFSETGYFSPTILDYLSGSERLRPFYQYVPEVATFNQVIEDKQQQNVDRQLLADTLTKQYEGIDVPKVVGDNIALLAKETTYTITTAHQPNIFTGYLYYVYKILTAVNLAEQLKTEYPDNDFVPIYWMGGEDHDFEEISQVNLYGEKLVWEHDEQGAVGRMRTNTLSPLIEHVAEKLGDQAYAEELVALLKRAYLDHDTLTQATRYLVNELFGQYGLVVLVQDDECFKQVLAPVIKEELLHERSFSLLEDHLPLLENAGYQAQAHPRQINLFYLQDNTRNRIEREGNNYVVLDTELVWTESEILAALAQHPERFSPNVILRPLFQEMLLPNLAYVGGGGELAYWMQLKPVFDHFEVNYPMLVLRSSACLIEGNIARKIDKLDLAVNDIFLDTDVLIKKYVKQHTEQELSLQQEKEGIDDLYLRLNEMAQSIDPTLQKAVEAQKQGLINALDNLEAKLLRAEKKNFDTATNQIRSIKERLFPNGQLQERFDNLIPFYARYGNGFIEAIKNELVPMDKEFTILFLDA